MIEFAVWSVVVALVITAGYTAWTAWDFRSDRQAPNWLRDQIFIVGVSIVLLLCAILLALVQLGVVR